MPDISGGQPGDAWVPIVEQPLFTPRKLKVACIGAGFSGLSLAYHFKHETSMSEYVDLKMFEKNHDVGGTWLENRYPGVACDVPAHIYSFSFEPNPEWSQFYASGPEIWEYIKRTTEKYGLDDRIQFKSKILETIWDDSQGVWRVKVHRLDSDTVEEDSFDVVINSTGFLNKWRWPNIQGLQEFQGEKVHSAAWNPNLDWTGKRVAVIGNGSSAIQILPQMQKSAKHVTSYIRSPTWISSNFVAQFTKDGGNFHYSEEEKAAFRDPETHKKYRQEIEHALNGYFFGFLKDNPVQQALHGMFTDSMQTKLEDAGLREKLIPDFHVGCRRLTPGDGYLEALQAENVKVDLSGIERITPKGIQSQDDEEEFDVIVCATGFDVSFTPFWKLIGKNGVSLAEEWKENPEAYFGLCAPHIPNYFIFTGPNSPLGNGSIFPVIDSTCNYVLKWIRKIATEDIKCITGRQDATREYNDYSQEFLKRTVWAGGCRSWYKNHKEDGRVTALYGGSVLHFKEMLDSFRVEDFNIEYRSRNRFRFMGNGLTATDIKGENLAYYMTK